MITSMKTISVLLCANFQLNLYFCDSHVINFRNQFINLLTRLSSGKRYSGSHTRLQNFSFTQAARLLNSSSALHHKNIFSRVP